jgi:hypothetical protein
VNCGDAAIGDFVFPCAVCKRPEGLRVSSIPQIGGVGNIVLFLLRQDGGVWR